jgi:hypothetical protein
VAAGFTGSDTNKGMSYFSLSSRIAFVAGIAGYLMSLQFI